MAATPPDFTECHGCSLCLLVCPVWQQTRDVALAPKGVARALQHNAASEELRYAANACILCGACNTVCPQDIDLFAMMLDLRHIDCDIGTDDEKIAIETGPEIANSEQAKVLFIPGKALQEQQVLLGITQQLINEATPARVANDIGNDIVKAVESGLAVSEERLQQFLKPLRKYTRIIVDDGLLFRCLLQWLPQVSVVSLGAVLSDIESCRDLGPGDLYVINSRAYHADYSRLCGHYDNLVKATECKINLDLNRVAIPTLGGVQREMLDSKLQVEHLLEDRDINRIVVEDVQDVREISNWCNYPVMHVAEFINHVRAA
jgi:ferredoxin